jgi:hypothetical protein
MAWPKGKKRSARSKNVARLGVDLRLAVPSDLKSK